METKDWVYIIGLMLTFITSLASLILSIKNRRNALREHIYKEQIELLKELRTMFADIANIYTTEVVPSKANKENSSYISSLDKMELSIDRIGNKLQSYSFLLPDKLVSVLYDALTKSNLIYFDILLDSPDDDVLKLETDFFLSIHQLDYEIRELVGVDRLSEENANLIGKQLNKPSIKLNE